MKLEQIWTYPVKSLGGFQTSSQNVQIRGLENDRRWMLTDENGIFLTQRTLPELCLFAANCFENRLVITHKKDPNFRIETSISTLGKKVLAKVWDDSTTAIEPDPRCSEMLSQKVGRKLKLVYMSPHARRKTDPKYADAGQFVSFADAFPFLLIGSASLIDLNARLEHAIPMDRFRPNLVISGMDAFAEDRWADFSIGSVQFRAVKPCARCILPTTDQATGLRTAEPLKTLASYRTVDNKVLFGVNVILRDKNQVGKVIRVGDSVELL